MPKVNTWRRLRKNERDVPDGSLLPVSSCLYFITRDEGSSFTVDTVPHGEEGERPAEDTTSRVSSNNFCHEQATTEPRRRVYIVKVVSSEN